MDFVALFNFILELNKKETLLFCSGFAFGLLLGYLFCKKFCRSFTLQSGQKQESFFFRCPLLEAYTPLFTKQGTKITHSTCDYYKKGKCAASGKKCEVFDKIQ